MKLSPKAPRWILQWIDDSADEDHDIRETADSVEETRQAIRRILDSATWTPKDADEVGGDRTEPACTALVRDEFAGDLDAGLLDLGGEAITFRCDAGTLTVEREP